MTMYKNQTSRNAMARRRGMATGDRRAGFDTHACDFAWEFGWSASDWDIPCAPEGCHQPAIIVVIDRALALAG